MRNFPAKTFLPFGLSLKVAFLFFALLGLFLLLALAGVRELWAQGAGAPQGRGPSKASPASQTPSSPSKVPPAPPSSLSSPSKAPPSPSPPIPPSPEELWAEEIEGLIREGNLYGSVGPGSRYIPKVRGMLFFERPYQGVSLFPESGGPVPEPTAQSVFGKRLAAYERTVTLIREEKFSDALAFIRRQSKEVREWLGLMSLEAALLTRSDSSEALKIYDRIFSGKERNLHFSRALTGYKSFLVGLSDQGDYGARFRLIKCLAFEWRNGEARELIRVTLLEPGVPEALRRELLSFEATLAIREGDLDFALEYFKDKGDIRSLRWLSTIYVRKGDFKRGSEARIRAANYLKGNRRLGEYVKSFDILSKGGLVSEAEELLVKVPELKGKVPAYSFYLGIGSLVKGDAKGALKYLEPETKEKGERGVRALYYKGRALETLLRYTEAYEAYKGALKGPEGYYRLLSEGRYLLMEKGGKGEFLSVPLSHLFLLLLKSPTGEDEDSLGYYLWLTERLPPPWPDERVPFSPKGSQGGDIARVKTSIFHHLYKGAPGRAREEILNAPSGFISKKAIPITEENARVALLLARSGEYHQAVLFLNSFSVKNPKDIRGRWNHPLVYGREIERAYTLYGLPPELILSVIRTESAFRKDAVSLSNARGLMQLLPSTAEKLSHLLGDPVPRDEDLFDPSLNIRYGSYYLSLLIDSFGSAPMAICAYNGGPFNMETLIATRGGLPMDLFVETLPFSETSTYLRRILEASHAYQKAYFGRADYPDLTGPVRPPRAPHPGF